MARDRLHPSANGLTYTITLRKGVKFSDGTPMTSKDVQFSLEQTMAASQGWGYIDSAIKSVGAPSADTVMVNLKYKWAPILADLALFANGVVPDNYGGKTAAAFYNAPVGTGPFKFDYWHKGSALKLVKNTNYWQPGKPYLNSVTWTDVPNDNTRQLQVTPARPRSTSSRAWSTVAQLKANPAVGLNLFPSTETTYLAFNEHVKPFQDVNVRQAISYAIDRTALVKAVVFGNGQAGQLALPAPSAVLRRQQRRPAVQHGQAKAALAKSSEPNGFTTTLTVPSGNSDYATIATIVQSELKPLGIKVKIQTLDPNTANENFQSGKYDMEFSLWTMDIPDPDELATFGLDPDVRLEVVLHLLQQPDRGQGGAGGRGDDRHRGASGGLQHRPDAAPRRTPSWRSCTTRPTRTWRGRTCTASTSRRSATTTWRTSG